MQDETSRIPFRERPRFSPQALAASGIVIAAAGFFLGYILAARADAALPAAPEGVDFSPVWKAWQIIDEKFVPASVSSTTPHATTTAEINEERVWGMVQGLASSLGDPYTFFLPPKENEQFAQDMSGAFEGVGMEIAVRDSVLIVVSPLRGTPAERAGIRSGDRILEIDGEETAGLDVSAAVSKIRGPKGTSVTLLMLRSGWEEAREIPVVREVINVPIVATEARDGVFVIELLSFTANSPELFREALREFIESGYTDLVLDLRGNPGGYLEAAVDMASWFLPSGRVIVTEDYAGHSQNIVHRSRGYDVFNEHLDMVILTDKGTASASEILAGALRHWGVAEMIGENTFGKGSVQELVDLTDDTALKITVARWIGPDGEQIPLEGLAPDVEVKHAESDAEAGLDPQMEKALEILRSR